MTEITVAAKPAKKVVINDLAAGSLYQDESGAIFAACASVNITPVQDKIKLIRLTKDKGRNDPNCPLICAHRGTDGIGDLIPFDGSVNVFFDGKDVKN